MRKVLNKTTFSFDDFSGTCTMSTILQGCRSVRILKKIDTKFIICKL